LEIEELSRILKEGKSSGHDEIDPGAAKYSLPFISNPLTYIFNLSLTSGIVPCNLKLAKVIPIHKANDPAQFNNYRPISVLPAFSKLMEKIVYNRLISFINKHNILTNAQYGFRSNHSTYMALMDLIIKVTESINKKHHTMGVFLDLSKAFDTINHDILLTKLHHYGIRGTPLNWFESYLTNRKQYVQTHSVKSSLSSLSCGVPQGSILGPLLFLLYINDITQVSNKLSFIIFADDTNLFASHSNLHDLHTIINEELALLTTWFKTNKLSLNINKTNYMLFSLREAHSSNTKISIDNQYLQQVTSSKFLGVTVDEHLTWKTHINNIKIKVSRAAGILTKLKHILPKRTLITIYNSLVLSHLTYCNIVWGNTYNSRLKPLMTLQNKAIKAISFANYRDHVTPLYLDLRFLKLTHINTLQTAIFMFKLISDQLPVSFNHYFNLNNSVHSHFTRQTDHFHLPNSMTTNFALQSILYHGPHTWNSLPTAIHHSYKLPAFKKLVHAHLLSNYTL
jgi:hypothetical protein